MLAKCANPVCNTPFRRLSEGKLFLVEGESAKGHEVFDSGKSRPPRRIEYFWLCNPCARLLTLAFNAKTGVMTVPLPPASPRGLILETARKPLGAERTAGILARAAGFHHD
jgi:hypothetical protein